MILNGFPSSRTQAGSAFMGGAELKISDPVVSFRESVSGTSDHMAQYQVRLGQWRTQI